MRPSVKHILDFCKKKKLFIVISWNKNNTIIEIGKGNLVQKVKTSFPSACSILPPLPICQYLQNGSIRGKMYLSDLLRDQKTNIILNYLYIGHNISQKIKVLS